eukprot:31473-Pelagococcus_subviridis.AAC.10
MVTRLKHLLIFPSPRTVYLFMNLKLPTRPNARHSLVTTLIIKQIPGLEHATFSGDWSIKDNANGTIVAPHHVCAYVNACTDVDGNGPEFNC